MAKKVNYNFQKRQKELQRQKKKEEKALKKIEKAKGEQDGDASEEISQEQPAED